MFYGTTRFGGSGCLRDGGCGTVFSLDPTTEAEAVLHRFKSKYGEFPNSNLSYHAGSLIGDTSDGGNRACERGCGINFKIKATTGRETVLEDFESGGENYSGITVVDGNAYETLPSGGSGGYGELLAVNLKSGRQTVLYVFMNNGDGKSPQEPLTYHNGVFYGTTFFGGNDNCYEGCGTVFKFVP